MPKATLATACTMLADMDDADELTRRYRAIVARIDRYPVTDPAMRAWALAEIERIYRADLRVALSPEAGMAPSDGGDDLAKF